MGRNQFIKHNNGVFKKGVLAHKSLIERELQSALRDVAMEVRDIIQEGGATPFYTGNMQDSTGLAVYLNGVLSPFVPFAVAQEPQKYQKTKIWGADLLQDALNMGASDFGKGLWIVIISAVPYALKVDTSGSKYHESGYFSAGLTSQLKTELRTALATRFPNVAR